jgi:hypothetical protein
MKVSIHGFSRKRRRVQQSVGDIFGAMRGGCRSSRRSLAESPQSPRWGDNRGVDKNKPRNSALECVINRKGITHYPPLLTSPPIGGLWGQSPCPHTPVAWRHWSHVYRADPSGASLVFREKSSQIDEGIQKPQLPNPPILRHRRLHMPMQGIFVRFREARAYQHRDFAGGDGGKCGFPPCLPFEGETIEG